MFTWSHRYWIKKIDYFTWKKKKKNTEKNGKNSVKALRSNQKIQPSHKKIHFEITFYKKNENYSTLWLYSQINNMIIKAKKQKTTTRKSIKFHLRPHYGAFFSWISRLINSVKRRKLIKKVLIISQFTRQQSTRSFSFFFSFHRKKPLYRKSDWL